MVGNAYSELSKLYQYVLEENNSLKKQKCRTERNNIHISERLASKEPSINKSKKNKQTEVSLRDNNKKKKQRI